ncbi:MAG TPA: WXG100 family type VII secretion target [Actinocrinis sp.]|uniref:WXG100 family type VII secretion target n=1 Tax=Actinocrinis sp. TaxID=1920516 RepID=UPI002DDC97A1|nr:WXG100 family type VII secretion target [Actinocrinis sp.]HEV2346482.1 WXG100 family type VII secretion target [Actinocrinis sp.]
MAGSFNTDATTMQKAAQQVQQVSDEISGELRALQGNLDPVAASWKGAAASAFQQLMVRWNEDAAKLTSALQGIAEMLDSTNKNYTQVEEANHSQISNILSGLG